MSLTSSGQFQPVSCFHTPKCIKGMWNSFCLSLPSSLSLSRLSSCPFLQSIKMTPDLTSSWGVKEDKGFDRPVIDRRIDSFQVYKSHPLTCLEITRCLSLPLKSQSDLSVSVQIENEFQNPVHHSRHSAGHGNNDLWSRACPCTSMWYGLSTNSAWKESMLHCQQERKKRVLCPWKILLRIDTGERQFFCEYYKTMVMNWTSSKWTWLLNYLFGYQNHLIQIHLP